MRTLPRTPGGLLDYEAVKEGLFSGQVAGLGLDVQGQEPVPASDWLVHHPCVYLTPHVAGVTEVSCECRPAGVGGQSACAGASFLLPSTHVLQCLTDLPCRSCPPADRNMSEIVAEAVRRVRRGLPPERLLNAPERPRGAAAAAPPVKAEEYCGV